MNTERLEILEGQSLRIDGVTDSIIVRLVKGKMTIASVECGAVTHDVLVPKLFEFIPIDTKARKG